MHYPPAAADYCEATADIPLMRSGRSPEELRSYRYFMEVTAPSLAGALHTNFWLLEMPRVCHADQAIWHAMVSLGAVHQTYMTNKSPRDSAFNAFALRHYNAAIKDLVESISIAKSRWKTLTLSTIFTCICILEGQLDQARMHWRSGYHLLLDFDHEEEARLRKLAKTGQPLSAPPELPVSVSSVRSMLIAFEALESKMDKTKISQPPTLLSEADTYSFWKTYTAPKAPLVLGRYLTVENISKAVQAAESLFMALIFSSQSHGKELKALYTEHGYGVLRQANQDQSAQQRGFVEVENAATLFRSELDDTGSKLKLRPTKLAELHKAVVSLRLLQSVNQFLLRHDPEQPDAILRQQSLPELCTHIVDLAEEATNLEAAIGYMRTGGPISSPTIMNPLLVVAKSGFGVATRLRAQELLWKPRMEGVWDSRLASCLAEKMLLRESFASRQYREVPGLKDVVIDNPIARGWDGDGSHEDMILPLARISNASMIFTSGRSMRVFLRTWKEWLDEEEGEAFDIEW